MTSETLETLNDLMYQMKVVQDDFRLNPSVEGQFAARIVGQSMNFMDMHCQNEYGVKLYPLARPQIEFEAELPTVSIADVDKAVPTVTVGKPKAKK